MITDQINTMIGLEGQDREAAQQQMDRQLNLSTKLFEIQQSMQKNAVSAFQNLVDSVGYAGLSQMTQGNPYYTNLVEQTLGLGQGGLQRLANLPPSAEDTLDLKLKQAQLSNIYSQIEERKNAGGGVQTLTGKPQSASQASANGYADRLNESNIVIDTLGSKFTGDLAIGGSLPNFLQSGDRQAYEQAKRNFVNAVLRRESGAAISPTEFDSAQKQYFPQA